MDGFRDASRATPRARRRETTRETDGVRLKIIRLIISRV